MVPPIAKPIYKVSTSLTKYFAELMLTKHAECAFSLHIKPRKHFRVCHSHLAIPMNRIILKSLLRDVKSLRKQQENMLNETKQLETRLNDLIDDEPKQWSIFGLKITREKRKNKAMVFNDSFTNSIQEHIYYTPPNNFNAFEGTEL